MAITCFVGDHIAIDVGDPGYGYVVVEFHSDDPDRWGKDRECTLRGRQMWKTLESLTRLVCNVDGESRGDVDGLWPMTVLLASSMLPQFQTAVLYAAAGSDRAERLTDDDEAHHLLCVRCNEGSVYSSHKTISDDCERHGHQPFGYAGNWERAQETAASDRRWAELMAQPVGVPVDAAGQPE
jgi:hypothetical protein